MKHTPVPGLFPQDPDSNGKARTPVVPLSRRPALDWDVTIPRHFIRNNAVATHMFNGLNLLFPYGERFFIRAVMDHLPKVQDPLLLAQVKGFVTQEGVHAHEHDRYFDALRGMGYRIDTFRRRFRKFMDVVGKLPKALRLSITAAAEHYTATFSSMALEDDFIAHELHPTMRKLIVWHCTEEVEHKAVAFDVLRATHPGYLLRLVGFFIATAALASWGIVGAWMLLRQDKLEGNVVREDRKNVLTRNNAEFPRTVWRNLRAYMRRGFHPNDIDNLELARQRMIEIGLEPAATPPAQTAVS